MKNSIKLSALFLLLSTGVFAASSTKTAHKETIPSAQVSFSGAKKPLGLNISVASAAAARSFVMFYDADNHMLVRDFLKAGIKNYDLSELETGDYKVTVTTNQNVVIKIIHIYEGENRQKDFFIMQ